MHIDRLEDTCTVPFISSLPAARKWPVLKWVWTLLLIFAGIAVAFVACIGLYTVATPPARRPEWLTRILVTLKLAPAEGYQPLSGGSA